MTDYDDAPPIILTPEQWAADVAEENERIERNRLAERRKWCPCHGEGGTYTAMVHGYHVSQDRVQSFPCPQAREMKECRT